MQCRAFFTIRASRMGSLTNNFAGLARNLIHHPGKLDGVGGGRLSGNRPVSVNLTQPRASSWGSIPMKSNAVEIYFETSARCACTFPTFNLTFNLNFLSSRKLRLKARLKVRAETLRLRPKAAVGTRDIVTSKYKIKGFFGAKPFV